METSYDISGYLFADKKKISLAIYLVLSMLCVLASCCVMFHALLPYTMH